MAEDPLLPVAFLLAPQAPATGNAATADRLRRIFEARGLRVVSVDPNTLLPDGGADGEGAAAVDASGAAVCVALHGIKSARLVVGCRAPLVVVTGGTDVNVDIAKDSDKAATMARVLRWEGTAAVVSFSQAMIDAMHALLEATAAVPVAIPARQCRTAAPPVHLIPQGVDLPPRPEAGSAVAAQVQRVIQAVLHPGETVRDARQRVLLLVAGLRPVKDVLFLADAVDGAWGDGKDLRLVILGGRLDEAYGAMVEERAHKSPGAFILLPHALCREACVEVMRHCAAVVNSSTSEGMSGALLESLAVGTPVLARMIPGNLALADMARAALGAAVAADEEPPPPPPGGGGVVIYDSPDDFVQQSEALFSQGGAGAAAAGLGVEGLRAVAAIASDERSKWHAVLDAVLS